MKGRRGLSTALALGIIALAIILVLLVVDTLTHRGEKAQPNSPDMAAHSDYQSIKRDIATGAMKDVPPDIDMTKNHLIMEYLFDCSLMELNPMMDCYEQHYFTKDSTLRTDKDSCAAKTGDEKTVCMDAYYTRMAYEQNSDFCLALSTDDRREACRLAIQ
jgi:hypothetical protein